MAILRLVWVALLLVLLMSCKKEKNSLSRPNVVIIMTDDQGWGDLSYHGNTNLSTPHIDSLALNGASFANYYVQPVCSPTRAEFLTGIYHTRLGVFDTSAGGERMALGVETIAEVFKKHQYRTAAYGKWHNGMQPPYHPNSRGFEDFYGFCSGHWGNYFSPMLEHNGEIVKGQGYLPNDLFDRAIQFISESKNQSFFLFLPVNTPHSPMQVPDSNWNMIKNRDLKLYGDENENDNFTKAALAMVENIDWNVGRLVNALKNQKLFDNTIVLFMSDNGPNSNRWNNNLKGRKGSTDEGGVKSPLFIQWPEKITPGKQIQQVAGAIDLLPTLTNLAGFSYEKDKYDGIDLSDLILTDSKELKPRVLYNHWNGKTSLRTQNYRLDSENQLFDVAKDPSQKTPITLSDKTLSDSLSALKMEWEQNALASIQNTKNIPYTIGSQEQNFSQLPARDAHASGSIHRSNRWPNDSFFTNWTNISDSITWPVHVLEEGTFEVTLYYTCKTEDVGTTLKLSHNENSLLTTIDEAHDPELIGQEFDRVPRMESYTKEFKPKIMGTIHLTKGSGNLVLKATEIPGNQAIDFRLLNLVRKEQ